MTRKKVIVWAAALVAVSLIPVPYLASPEWHVQVVDESGKPLQGMTVRIEHKNYSVETRGHEEDRLTDEHGDVVFPKHTRSASTLRRCIFTALSATAFAHASFGPHAYVFAFGKGLEGDALSGDIVTDWSGQLARMDSRIVAKQVFQ
jgi:hypothetical protein